MRPPPRKPTTNTNTNTSTTATKTRTKVLNKVNTQQSISLKGSTTIISDYFHYALNTILFQRSIYDQNEFKMVKKFGLQMMLFEDQSMINYLDQINSQLKDWLMTNKLKKLVLVIIEKQTNEIIERWEFD
ncbi:hypothetical protein CROQUDRAFT_42803, partial [Cronartium quercuum f. sp. fusiforme G11]